jgi:hypothetical protein
MILLPSRRISFFSSFSTYRWSTGILFFCPALLWYSTICPYLLWPLCFATLYFASSLFAPWQVGSTHYDENTHICVWPGSTERARINHSFCWFSTPLSWQGGQQKPTPRLPTVAQAEGEREVAGRVPGARPPLPRDPLIPSPYPPSLDLALWLRLSGACVWHWHSRART